MAATRGRMSLASDPAAVLEGMDAFKRKHVSQNKEIIHKNSELMKTNGDLGVKLREAQQDLMVARAEAIRLKGVNFQLDVQNAHLREMLRRETERVKELESDLERATNGASFPQRRLQLLQQALEGIAENAKQAQSLIEEARSPVQTRRRHGEDVLRKAVTDMVVPLAPADSPSQSAGQKTVAPNKSRRSTLATQPDLSFISEASTEAELKDNSNSARRSRSNTPVEQLPRPSTPPANEPLSRQAAGPVFTPPVSDSSSPAPFRRSISTTPPNSPPPAPLLVEQQPVGIEPPRPASVPPQSEVMPQKKRLDLGGIEQAPRWPAGPLGGESRRTSALHNRSVSDDLPNTVTTRPRGSTLGRSASTPLLSKAPPSIKDMKPRSSEASEQPKGPMRQIVKPRVTSAPAPSTSTSKQHSVYPDPSESSASEEEGEGTAAGAAKVRALKEVTGRKNNTAALAETRKVKAVEREGSVDSIVEVQRAASEPLDGQTDGRRTRKEVNYAQPSLNKKLRRPVDYVPTIARHRKPRPSSRKSHAPAAAATSGNDGSEEEAGSDGDYVTAVQTVGA